MTDIVERLREGVFGTDETKTDAVIHSHMQAAADEIERLRAECQRLADEVSRAHTDALTWMERAAAADADIERLRASLLALTIHEEATARREGLEPCYEAQEARALLEDGR